MVVLWWLIILITHMARLSSEQYLALWLVMQPLVVPIVLLVAIIAGIFGYAVICSIAVVFMVSGKYQTAERLYKLTLAIRQKLPVIGSTARVDFWNVSLANCYREQNRLEEAEKLYRMVLDRQDNLGWI